MFILGPIDRGVSMHASHEALILLTRRSVRSQSRADQIEVSLNEDIKSKEERKTKRY